MLFSESILKVSVSRYFFEKFVKVCLHWSYTQQNFFNFAEIFHKKYIWHHLAVILGTFVIKVDLPLFETFLNHFCIMFETIFSLCQQFQSWFKPNANVIQTWFKPDSNLFRNYLCICICRIIMSPNWLPAFSSSLVENVVG